MPRESLDLDKHSHQLGSSWSKKSHHLAKKHRRLEEGTLVKNSLCIARVFLLCVTIATRCQCNSIVSSQSEFANNKPRFEAAADEPFTTSIFASHLVFVFLRNIRISPGSQDDLVQQHRNGLLEFEQWDVGPST